MKPPLPLWAALIVAAGAGAVLDGGFPDRAIWLLAIVGVGLVLVTLIGRRLSSAALVGFVAGLSFYLTHIQWASLFLGPLPMTALAVLQSLFFAAGAVVITAAYRWVPRAFPSALGRVILVPVIVSGLWTAREAWSSVWPYGGFAWGRIGLSQAEGPLAPLFGWVGISGMTFLLVLVAAVTVEAVRATDLPKLSRIAAPVGISAALLVVPFFPVSVTGDMTVAAVQGNGKAGYFDNSSADDLLRAQFDATEPLFGSDVDVVVWPEGTTFRDPLADPYTTSVFDFVSEEMDAPLIAQGVSERDGSYYNTAVLWKAGEGALDYYDKKHPVPFGEYVPDREFWRPFAPDLIDLIQREYTPGTTDPVIDVDGVIAGINICFDIVDDQILTESVEEGAQIIFASSNNADFGRTDESVQQLAIARVRALELGRTVVNISTVGISAMIAPDGTTIAELPWYEPGAMVESVPLSETITPAVAAGRQIEWFVSALGIAGLLGAWFARTKRPRSR
ncbi:apolipoprotein N-acyltransferase [Antiquaquibacter oligotrophicus]|uniref:apolipoprotein N-acyltransferase n=1 Tax=Antiquaquibacter oligotrophicus TaxID=2880260 RepID=UPI002AC8CA63|nr:apolipoprotein N-acyltransferase [Antiquaquibacter oligotrophicus]